MAEMLPEFWSSSKPDDDDTKRAPPCRPCQVIDVFTWIHCYAAYVSVLAGQSPGDIPELLAYMVTITRESGLCRSGMGAL